MQLEGIHSHIHIGMAHYDAEHPCCVEALLDRADAMMYTHKRQRGLEKETIPLIEDKASWSCFYERMEDCDG